MKSSPYLPILILLSLTCWIASCSNQKQQEALDHAESLMESYPDSSLVLLEEINKMEMESKEGRARYALLMSMALDKNYIDTTKFDGLQPAIDYYLKYGDANEKLRTYFYQGRIYQNRGDLDNALNSFVKGIDIANECNDSLCIARTLVAQGALYDAFCDYESYIDCHLRAAEIYKKLSRSRYEFDCLINALNGALALGNKTKGDSLLSLCESFKNLDNDQEMALIEYRLSHANRFNDVTKINDLIGQLEDNPNLDVNCLLNLALACHKAGNNEKAKHLLDYVKKGHTYDTIKYLAISVPVYKKMGNYKDALTAYEEYSYAMDSINTLKFDQKSKSLEEKHALELKAQQDAREKAIIIWGCVGGMIFLIMVIVILFLLFRSNKSQKELAAERAKSSELENKSLKSEKENLVLENKNLQLEMDKKALEAENLAHRVKDLEEEKSKLNELMNSQEELPSEVQQAIKVRIEMLNALMAGYITDNEKYEKPYESWIKDLTDNTEEFMNSNRLAFQASHPRFIQYFEEHDLTVSEINYVCLYALGLKGKEVGSYIKKRSHVNISSGIRKKLGIDKHETNIGIYVRKLLKEL